MTSMRPVPGMYPVSQPFNGSFSTQFSGGAAHGAIDFATPIGTPIVAPDDGVIVFADWAWNLPGGPNDWAARWFQLKPASGNERGGGGIMTVLRNDAGSHWIFAHLSSNDEAPVGKRVRRGDIIGKTGNTGTSTGPHLHLALVPPNPKWANGTYGSIDPARWLTIPYAPNTYTSWAGTPTSGIGSASKIVTAQAVPLNWIDVSDYQPDTVIRDVPTDAVVIKASEGVGFRAKKLDAHVQAAVRKGIPFMLYHFARGSVNSSEAEVAYFRKVVAPYLKQPLCAGLVLDFEEDAIMHYGAWGEDFLAQLRRELPGVHLVLYTRAAFLRAKGWSATTKAKTPVWIAAYGTDQRMDGYATSFAGAPTVPGWHIAAWQYSQRGRLKGYAGDLDLNRTLPGAVPMWPSRVAKSTTVKKELDMTPDEVRNEMRKALREEAPKIIREEIPKIEINSPEKGGKKMTLAEHWRWQRHDRGKQIQFRKDVTEKFATLAESALSIIDRLTTKEK